MKLRTKSNTSRHQTGFTLVELMVSITIGLFLLAAMGGIYFSSSRIFSATGATTAMDENARAIFDLIGVSVRQAGFNGCADFSGTITGDIRRIPPGGWEWHNDIANPVQGLALTGSDSRFPGSLPGTNVLILVGVGSQRDVSVVWDAAGGAIVTGNHDFQPGQVLLASSCQLNSFFVMSGGNTNTVTHSTVDNCDAEIGTNCAGAIGEPSAVPIPYTLPPGSLIMPVVANAYFIADSEISGKGRSLWSCTTPTDCREMANGVENLRLSFALNTTESGSIDRYVSANTPNIDWSQVRAVKVNLLLATLPGSDVSSTGSNEYTFNGQTVTPSDRRIYREYTMVFALRNKTL